MIELHFVGAGSEKSIRTKACPAVLFKCEGGCIKRMLLHLICFYCVESTLGSPNMYTCYMAYSCLYRRWVVSKNTVCKSMKPIKRRALWSRRGRWTISNDTLSLNGESLSFLFIYLYEFPWQEELALGTSKT